MLGLDLSKDEKQRLAQLNELDAIRQDAIQTKNIIHQQRKRSHEQFTMLNKFKPSDWAALFDSIIKYFKGNSKHIG